MAVAHEALPGGTSQKNQVQMASELPLPRGRPAFHHQLPAAMLEVSWEGEVGLSALHSGAAPAAGELRGERSLQAEKPRGSGVSGEKHGWWQVPGGWRHWEAPQGEGELLGQGLGLLVQFSSPGARDGK